MDQEKQKRENIFQVMLTKDQAQYINENLPQQLKVEVNTQKSLRPKKIISFTNYQEKQFLLSEEEEEQVIEQQQQQLQQQQQQLQQEQEYSEESEQTDSYEDSEDSEEEDEDEDFFDETTRQNTIQNSQKSFTIQDIQLSMKQLLEILGQQPYSGYFFNPTFDTQDDQEDIDLSIITNKCQKGYYTCAENLKYDLEKMFELFYFHHTRGSLIYQQTMEMQKIFIQQYSELVQKQCSIQMNRLNSEKNYFTNNNNNNQSKFVKLRISKNKKRNAKSSKKSQQKKKKVQWSSEKIVNFHFESKGCVSNCLQQTTLESLKMPDYDYDYTSSSESDSEDYYQQEQQDRKKIRFTVAREISDIKYESDMEEENENEEEQMPKKSCLKQQNRVFANIFYNNNNKYEEDSVSMCDSDVNESTVEQENFFSDEIRCQFDM